MTRERRNVVLENDKKTQQVDRQGKSNVDIPGIKVYLVDTSNAL